MRNQPFFILVAHCLAFVPIARPVKALGSDVTVPFVGCRSDGQIGPLNAPKGRPRVVHLTAEVAQRLAYYKAEQGQGVLAPRGWHCFATYGSSGSSLFVSPSPLDSALLLSPEWRGFTSPIIQLTYEYGGTSGRFGVARVIARVFPKHRAFVKKVIAEGIVPATEFPAGPFPKDKLVYRSSESVEYQTPAQTEGLGTHSRLLPGNLSISGIAVLVGQEPNLLFLASRLPSNMADLATIIVQQVEDDAPRETP